MRSKIFQEIIDETPKDVEIFVRWYAHLVIRINELINKKGLNQKALAEQLGKQPSEIHKWLNGGHNFTLRSLAKLQAELGDALIEIPIKKVSKPSFQASVRGTTFTVHSNVVRNTESVKSWTTIPTTETPLANAG